ncbi:Cro/CI family transcriptional regulator [Marinomonas primoryensis]|uniref:Cro/CI family transcriptional regulator n=1 Tax=Marinomonas primoryensis TaxID=178399 RepID=UPI0037042181
MLKTEVIKHFGKAKLICEALGLSSGSISQWGEVIPETQAFRLERLTNGELKYDPSLYESKHKQSA